ncbi:hypothetical protein JKP88DRAFT_251641 [Tribonema minus]|uniref:Uncharacterized protein n=1 Tax=Tribonema minus TaxID=303371 RepID=A0A835ZBF5_9STRA|nr:hypothetical protein JKP88DRAFT_251641 [Tribonema minus]
MLRDAARSSLRADNSTNSAADRYVDAAHANINVSAISKILTPDTVSKYGISIDELRAYTEKQLDSAYTRLVVCRPDMVMAFFGNANRSATLEEAIYDMASIHFSTLRIRQLTNAHGWCGSPRYTTGSFAVPGGTMQLRLKASIEKTDVSTLVVKELFVPEVSRGKGVCTSLLKDIIPDLAMRAGFTQVLVNCTDNDALLAVLRRWGSDEYVECSYGMFFRLMSDIHSLQWGEPLVESPRCVILQMPPALKMQHHSVSAETH